MNGNKYTVPVCDHSAPISDHMGNTISVKTQLNNCAFEHSMTESVENFFLLTDVIFAESDS